MYVCIGQAELYRKDMGRMEGQKHGKMEKKRASGDQERGGGQIKQGKRGNKEKQSRAYKKEIISKAKGEEAE